MLQPSVAARNSRQFALPDGQINDANPKQDSFVQSFREKYFVSFFQKNMLILHASRLDTRGASADRHETWGGMRWTQKRRARGLPRGRTALSRTAKSCGPGTPRLVPSVQIDDLHATVTQEVMDTGESTKRPLKPLRRECR
jgi:hypothetical protein